MSKLLIGSIDLTKIDKKRIISTDKNGQPFQNGAKYLNIVLWINDEVDQYGNIASIQESITKEEREKGVKPTYLGNLKNVAGQNIKEEKPEELLNNEEIDDDLPF